MPHNHIHTILMTSDTIGGVWSYSLGLVRELARYRIQVHLATMGKPLSIAQWKEAGKLRNLTIHESSYKLEWMDDPWEDVDRAGEWLMELEDQIGPEVVHLNNYCHGNLSWKSPVLMVCHSCVYSWWLHVHGEEPPVEWSEYHRRVSEGLNGADKVIGISHTLLDQVRKIYEWDSPADVIYNGIDHEHYINREKQPFIFSMGRIWDHGKNLSMLNDLAEELPWPVMVAGDQHNPQNGEMIEMRRVIMPGWLDDSQVRERLSEASIYALPARYEPFGLGILEAAAYGCALLLGNIPSLRELWGNSALFINPDNPDEWGRKIRFLIRNPSERSKWQLLSHKRSLEYNIEKTASYYIKAYHFLEKKLSIRHKAGSSV